MSLTLKLEKIVHQAYMTSLNSFASMSKIREPSTQAIESGYLFKHLAGKLHRMQSECPFRKCNQPRYIEYLLRITNICFLTRVND